MSTIAVALKDGYAAIAADSMSKNGYQKESADLVINHHKIFEVGESYLAISGATSAKLAVKHFFSSLNTDISLSSVETIYRVWLHLHEELKDRYFLQPDNEESAFESSCMDVLIANPYGIFGVAAHRSVQEFSRFYAYGAGAEYAIGAMHAIYDNPEKSAEDVARIGVETACTFHDSSGLPVYSYSIKLRKPADADSS